MIRDTFVIAGGRDTDSYLKSIVQFNVTDSTWITREENLSEEKGFLGAVAVSELVVECGPLKENDLPLPNVDIKIEILE